jgi:hypothetical protein
LTGCCKIGASAVSGFFASACSLPFDYVKTQIQKMQPGPDGKYPYTGSLDCAMKTLAAGGPLKFYSGFGTYCVRIAPHVMVCILLVSAHVFHSFSLHSFSRKSCKCEYMLRLVCVHC